MSRCPIAACCRERSPAWGPVGMLRVFPLQTSTNAPCPLAATSVPIAASTSLEASSAAARRLDTGWPPTAATAKVSIAEPVGLPRPCTGLCRAGELSPGGPRPRCGDVLPWPRGDITDGGTWDRDGRTLHTHPGLPYLAHLSSGGSDPPAGPSTPPGAQNGE